MKTITLIIIFSLTAIAIRSVVAQTDTAIYHLTLKLETVNKAGKDVMEMTINGGIPCPALRFTEGDCAVIYVKNEMGQETMHAMQQMDEDGMNMDMGGEGMFEKNNLS